MNISQQFCFTHSPGEDIYLFTLRNANGTEVKITNYGAIITSFKIKCKDGTTNDIVLGFDKVEEYSGADYLAQYPWFGCATGRYANRIKNGIFEIDGKQYHLNKNNGDDQLHGGFVGFDKKVWTVGSFGDSPSPFLELEYTSPDGEEGFPGNLAVRIRFELNKEDELSYEYTAATDKPTAVNLTHHSYFNLNNGKESIHDHEIRIPASAILEQGENLVVTGNVLDVTGTAHDFREFKKIGNNEYDQSFIVDHPSSHQPVLIAAARSSASNIHLQVYSTEPVVHFYSGKWIPVVKGKNGVQYAPFSGLCLETHKHPNAVNVPAFPNTILRPGEKYFQKTVYKIIQA